MNKYYIELDKLPNHCGECVLCAEGMGGGYCIILKDGIPEGKLDNCPIKEESF